MLPTTILINQHWRRNRFAFLADYLGFGVGLVFANAATTLPAFAAVLTSNKIILGAISALWAGGWLLPQIFAAHYLTGQPRKYPIMMLWQFIGRPALLLFVIWLLVGGARYPMLTIALLLLAIMLFRVTDALVALAYWDIFGRAVPADRRGRLFGIGQVATGLLAIGASVIIQQVLGPRGPGFPLNYAVVFGLACACFAVSTIGTSLLVEIPEPAAEAAPPATSLRLFLPQLAQLWRADRRFNRITMVRVLTGLGALATTFYVVYATDVLHLPPAAVGLFAGAATAGAVLAGLLLGPVADRLGAHRVVQVVTWGQFLVPMIALLCHLGIFGTAVNLIYPLLYVLLGVFEGSFMLGFNNFILSIAPPGQRPAYMGLTNTFAGLLIVVPLIGGYVLQVTSYPVLFVLAAIGTLAAALLALGLPHPGQPQAAAAPEAQPAAVP